MLCDPQLKGGCINVYDRNNMAAVKNVIPLPGLRPHSIAACSLSNCLYILSRVRYNEYSTWRIARADEHWSTAALVVSNMYLPQPTIRVTANGSLALKWRPCRNVTPLITCYANGSMQREVKLSIDINLLLNIRSSKVKWKSCLGFRLASTIAGDRHGWNYFTSV